MKLYLYIIFFLIASKGHAQLFGFVKDANTKEVLAGVIVKNINTNQVVQTNRYGFFSLRVTGRTDIIVVSFLGYEALQLSTDSVDRTTPITLLLYPAVQSLNEVKITANKLSNPEEPGKIKLTGAKIRELPLLLGEKDPLKAFQLLPGIQETSEGSASFSVRGGNKDKNLLLLDEAVVYNANHLFGFFSTFNPDPVSQAEIYKGAFPAQYGGRLSSVLDVKMKEGNKESYGVEGGIGLIASRLTVEGPIKKEKSSFLVSGRRTYADLLILPFQSEREKTGYNFMDFNAKANFILNPSNQVFLSYYTGLDHFYQKNKIPRRESYLLNNTRLKWSNSTFTSRWNSVIKSDYFLNLSLILSKYYMAYTEGTEQDYYDPPRFNRLKLYSDIQDFTLKLDNDYYIRPTLLLKWGTKNTFYQFTPRDFHYASNRTGEENIQNNSPIQNAHEGAAYFNFIGKSHHLFYEAGIRLSYYTPTKSFNPEPRGMIGYHFSDNLALSGAYSKMNQYIHLVSNTGNGLPTDIWIPANKTLRPSQSDILSVNLSYNQPGWSFTLDSYYKWITGNNEYRSGVSFLGITNLNNRDPFLWEDILTQGKSWNYGYELAAEKTTGRFTFWSGYTLSWSVSKFDDLNKGKPFYNRQDRRHILEFTGKYKLSKRLTLSSNFVFMSGQPLSVPDAMYFREDPYYNYLEVYSGFNNFRTEHYHRMDLGMTLKNKKNKNFWDFTIYNIYNRKNPYSYSIENTFDLSGRNVRPVLKRQWLIPILPSVSYNFNF